MAYLKWCYDEEFAKQSIHTISLIPLSFPVDSFGLEAGLGGGTMVPTERGVVGLAERKQYKKISIRKITTNINMDSLT